MNTTQTATAPLLGYQDDTVAITPDLPVVRVANLGRITDGDFRAAQLEKLLADNGSLPVAVLDRYRNDWRKVLIVDNDSPLLEDHTEVYATRPTATIKTTDNADILGVLKTVVSAGEYAIDSCWWDEVSETWQADTEMELTDEVNIAVADYPNITTDDVIAALTATRGGKDPSYSTVRSYRQRWVYILKLIRKTIKGVGA